MASPQASQKIFAENKIEMWDHDPGGTSATIVSPDGGTTKRTVDMKNYNNFACIAMASLLVGGITKVEIIAAEAATMASPVVIKDSGTVAADAVGDTVCLECTSEELAQEGADNSKDLRYAAGRITCSNAGDEAVVTYITTGGLKKLNLTPATTIS